MHGPVNTQHDDSVKTGGGCEGTDWGGGHGEAGTAQRFMC